MRDSYLAASVITFAIVVAVVVFVDISNTNTRNIEAGKRQTEALGRAKSEFMREKTSLLEQAKLLETEGKYLAVTNLLAPYAAFNDAEILASYKFAAAAANQQKAKENAPKLAVMDKLKKLSIDKFCLKLGADLRNPKARSMEPDYSALRDTAISDYRVTLEHMGYITDRSISLGMNSCEVVASLGRPEDINGSTGSYGRHEQWVYGSFYVYTENGIVTAWQD